MDFYTQAKEIVAFVDDTNKLMEAATAELAALNKELDGAKALITEYDATVAKLKVQLARSEKLAKLLSRSQWYKAKNPPYVFGGEDLTGMDCSGFMQTLFEEIGVNLPRVSADQINKGTSIPIGQEQPGDLLGFDLGTRNGTGIEHIGMCIGSGLMIHTAKAGEGINVADYKARYGAALVKVARVF